MTDYRYESRTLGTGEENISWLQYKKQVKSQLLKKEFQLVMLLTKFARCKNTPGKRRGLKVYDGQRVPSG